MSDNHMITTFKENNNEAWSRLYDKYAPAMYGIICNLTNDRTLAEEIFKKAFLQLKEKQIPSKVTYSLYPFLLRHANSFARQHLQERGIACSKKPVDETSLINIFCSQNISIKEAASNLNLTEVQAKEKLRSEFMTLRTQKKIRN